MPARLVGSPGSVSVVALDPLYMPAVNTVASRPAAAGQAGHIILGAQVLGSGKKTMDAVATGTLEIGAGPVIDGIQTVAPLAYSTTNLATVAAIQAEIGNAFLGIPFLTGSVKITENEGTQTFTVIVNNQPTLTITPTLSTFYPGTNPGMTIAPLQTTISNLLRLAFDSTNYVDFTCDNLGRLSINSTGNIQTIQTSDTFQISNPSQNTGVFGTGAFVCNGGCSMAGQSGFFGGLTSTEVATPTLRTKTAVPVSIFAGTTPGYQPAQSAQLLVQDIGSGGNADISAAAGSLVRFWTGTVPPLSLALSLSPTLAAFSSNILAAFANATQATSPSVASCVFQGGVGILKDLRVAGTIFGNISGAITPTVPFVLTGAGPQLQLQPTGGAHTANIGISTGGVLSLTTTAGQEIQTGSSNILRALSTTASNSSTTGAIVSSGGIGAAGNITSGAYVYGVRGVYTDAQDQLTLVNSVSGDVARIECFTTGDLNLRTTSGKLVGVPSINKFKVWSTGADAMQVLGTIQTAALQYTTPVYKEVNVYASLASSAINSTSRLVYANVSYHWAFLAGSDSDLYANIPAPDDMVPNTQITLRAHWFNTTAPAAGDIVRIVSSIQVVPIGGNIQTIPATSVVNLIPVTTTVTTAATLIQTLTPTTMPASNYTTFCIKISRQTVPNDTFGGSFFLTGLTLRYQTERTGKTW